ncbi:hypothetical protein GGR69_003390 [Xanthomonas arboricola]|nr:hypothetical protein [Xanthomonas arboricola]
MPGIGIGIGIGCAYAALALHAARHSTAARYSLGHSAHQVPMHAVIYHNPNCGTSRNTLALIRHTGIEPQIVDDLQHPPTRETLQSLIAPPASRFARPCVRKAPRIWNWDSTIPRWTTQRC